MGEHNIISKNEFFELDDKKQSEDTRNGIWAVEIPDTFGDARKADFNKMKGTISSNSHVGRDAYGRVEDMRGSTSRMLFGTPETKLECCATQLATGPFIIVYSVRAN